MPQPRSRHSIRIAVLAGVVALLGAGLTWLLVWLELERGRLDVNWTVFAVIAGLMLICERIPATWIRLEPAGTVTPMWMFAY